ncbi:MAG TPA: asparagine synthase-related protein [Allosphingosinicella sp.]|jgi:asparagine synthase (glutamine-hydrolysing)|nr:asparagine synthase-related protein [Allosphingosinicella sp.]
MLDAQRDYGPHRQALWSDGDVALGHRLYRLLPEDTSDRQPLIGGGGRFALTADLRLDDRDGLARALGAAAPPRGAPDSQLLLAAIERFGAAILEELVGDYAVALWDAAERRLTLARDILGQRPLHYHAGSGFFAFASMPKGLHALEDIPRGPNEARLARFLALNPIVGGAGYYEGIRRVEPGHIIHVQDGRIESRRYWTPRRTTLLLPRFEDYREAFREQLDQAVRARLRGAGDLVATHLSAGWDSSSVTATAARLDRDRHILAFTSVPRPGSEAPALGRGLANEGEIAAETAAMHPNVEHRLVPGAAASPIAELDLHHRLFDKPMTNLCNLVWLTEIRRQAQAAGARVLLTGENGNWTVSAAPYSLLADLIRERRWGAWLHEARALAAKRRMRLRGIAAKSFGPWLPSWLWNLGGGLSSRAETSAYAALHPDLARAMEQELEKEEIGSAWRPRDNFAATLQAFRHYDFGELRKGTLAGWGIDERDPTADRRLIEFCLSLPIEMLLKDGERRPLAHAALSDRLPRALLDETRKGYQAADWHEGMTRHRSEISQLLDRIAADPVAARLLDLESLRRWLRDWPSGGWEKPEVMARYRGALLTALSAGHFILAARG